MAKCYLYISLAALAAMLFSNCAVKQNEKAIEGDLYYSFFRFGNFYKQPDSIIKRIQQYVDTVDRKKLGWDEASFLSYYDVLKKKDLLHEPFIDLRLDNDSIVKIFFNTNDYEEIKKIKKQELLDQNKKVRITGLVDSAGHGIYIATKPLSIMLVDGQTLRGDKKFKIEDYN